jgi:hypothetical protein
MNVLLISIVLSVSVVITHIKFALKDSVIAAVEPIESKTKGDKLMRSIIAFCLGFIFLLSFPAWAEKNPLKGISGVRVFAYTSKDCETSGLTASSIQTEVELMLRQYGIKVLSQEEYKT